MEPSDLGLSALGLRLVDPATPPPLRLLAARGVAPALPPADALLVAVLLCDDPSDAVRAAAEAFVAAPPKPVLDATLERLGSAKAARLLAETLSLDAELAGRLFRNASADDAARCAVVRRAPVDALPSLAAMDAILASSAAALHALAARADASAAVRARCAEIAATHGLTLPAEPADTPVPTPPAAPDDDARVDEAIAALHASLGASEVDAAGGTASGAAGGDEEEETAEARRVLPLAKFLETLSVSQKIRRATIGSGEERAILVRDTNRLVAEAAITSPRIQENEVVRIASNRSVSSDVLRRIAESREWMKSYPIKVVLVQNPRLPLPLALRLLPMLREADVKRVATSRSVPTAVAAAAKREMQKKQ
jgi:hypothetical protein